jgi:hypothetical protein
MRIQPAKQTGVALFTSLFKAKHRAKRHWFGVGGQHRQLRQILLARVANPSLAKALSIPRDGHVRGNRVPDFQYPRHPGLFQVVNQLLLRLKTKPGVDNKRATCWRMANNRPDDVISRAAQLTVKRPVYFAKLRHKRLFDAVDGQNG